MDPKQGVMDRFRANLLRARKRAAMSQEELGELSGLHRTEIGMLERGIRLPRIDTLVRLAGALEVEPGELLVGIEWAPGPPVRGAFRFAEESPEGSSRSPRQDDSDLDR
jgi:transcriptional regulator with XRE-family HTH domain